MIKDYQNIILAIIASFTIIVVSILFFNNNKDSFSIDHYNTNYESSSSFDTIHPYNACLKMMIKDIYRDKLCDLKEAHEICAHLAPLNAKEKEEIEKPFKK